MSRATATAPKPANKNTNVIMSILNTAHGDKEKKFEDTPEGRSDLALKITDFIRQSIVCFLQVGTGSSAKHFKIKGYDPDSNEWLVEGTPQKISASGSEVLVVPPVSGG